MRGLGPEKLIKCMRDTRNVAKAAGRYVLECISRGNHSNFERVHLEKLSNLDRGHGRILLHEEDHSTKFA